MRIRARLWRWRSNPLKRHCDITEAWFGLAAGTLLVVATPAAGAATAWGVHEALLEQRQYRHPAPAVLTENASSIVAYSSDGRVRATVRWAAPDGSVGTGKALVTAGMKSGARTTVWLDEQGRLTDPPVTDALAEVQADLAGAAVAGGVCAVVLGGYGTARWQLNRRRARDWDREWAVVGPQWSRHRA